MNSNGELVESLMANGVLKSKSIRDALLHMDRKDFVLSKYEDLAYMDGALSIGYGQTISQPYTVVFMLELLDVQKGDKVLDIGTGSGWTSALLSYLTGKEGRVVGKELIDELVVMGKENISKYDIANATISKTEGVLGVENEKFDRILVSASANKFPKELLLQMKNDSVLVVPVQNSIYKVRKDKTGGITKEEYYGFSFVELKTRED